MAGGEAGLQAEKGNWQIFLRAEAFGRTALGILFMYVCIYLCMYVFLCMYVCMYVFLGSHLAAYGGSQAKGLIGSVAAGLHHSHSNARSELHLRPTPQLTTMPEP